MAPLQAEASVSATTPSQSGTGAPCHLLDLPPELRLIIYEELLEAIRPPFDADPVLLNNLEPALMSTSKFIRAEMLSLYLDHIEIIHDELLEETIARMMPFQGLQEKDRDNTTEGFWDALNDFHEWMRNSVLARKQRITHAQIRALVEMNHESAETFRSETQSTDELLARVFGGARDEPVQADSA